MFFNSNKQQGRGNFRSSSSATSRTELMAKLERERKEREHAQARVRSAELVQRVWRSHATRLSLKKSWRADFDAQLAKLQQSDMSASVRGGGR